MLESHLIRCEGPLIQESDLDAALFDKSPNATPITMDEIDAHTEEIKKQMVVKAVNESGSKAEASRRLGIAQNRLHYFLTKWGLVREIS